MSNLPNLFHYSAFPKLYQDIALYFRPPNPGKPQGFWISVEDDWERWCREENFNIESLTYKHKVTLKDNARLLIINTDYELIKFTHMMVQSNISESPTYTQFISHLFWDWEPIRIEFQGILIYPYLWECRLRPDTIWYNGWDCASGCIWDASCIEKFELIENEQYV